MKFKKSLAALLAVLMIVCALPLSSFAAKVGDTIDWVLYTDITTYINGYYIPSYNINGYTAVVVEDLLYYGFDVYWNAAAKTLKVTRNYDRDFCPPDDYKPTRSTHRNGDRAMPVLCTDIVTYFEGQKVTSYNVDGRTIAYVDDLASFYKNTYTYSDAERTLKLTLKGAAAPTRALSFTQQPKSVTVTNESGSAVFSVAVSGGVSPYVYRWQVAKNGSSVFYDITSSNTYSLNYKYTAGDSGTQLRCIVTDSAGNSKISDAATITVSAPARKITATLTAAATEVQPNSTTPLVVNVTNGYGLLTYTWYCNNSRISNAASASYYAKPTAAGTYKYYCTVTDANGSTVTTNTVTLTVKNADPVTNGKINISATVGEELSVVYPLADYGLTASYTSMSAYNGLGSTALDDYGLSFSLLNGYLYVHGTPKKSGAASGVFTLTREDKVKDTLTVNLSITGSSSGVSAATVNFTYGTYGSNRIYFRNISGLQSSYASTGITGRAITLLGANSGLYASNTAGMDGIEIYGTPTVSGSYDCTFSLKRQNGTTDYLTVTIKVDTAAARGYTASATAMVGVPLSQSFRYASYGIDMNGLTASAADSDSNTLAAYGLTASFDERNITIKGTPTKSGTAVYRVNFKRNGTVTAYLDVVVTISNASTTLKIISQPQSQNVSKASVTESITVSGGAAPYTYQWQYNSYGGWLTEHTETVSATGNSRTFTWNSIQSGTVYIRCIVTDASGSSVTSEVAAITVTPAASQPQNQSITRTAYAGSNFDTTISFERDFGVSGNDYTISFDPQYNNLSWYGLSVSYAAGGLRISGRPDTSGTAVCRLNVTKNNQFVCRLDIIISIAG